MRRFNGFGFSLCFVRHRRRRLWLGCLGTIAIQSLKTAGLPYVVVLTDPTTGGVLASYAMLGDIHIAEPNATLGFSGRRVIEQTIRETLPPGFQTSEFLVERGMVDRVVVRKDIPGTLGSMLGTLMAGRVRKAA